MTLAPDDWMPNARLDRVILHWTAGTSSASDFDRKHYHILVEGSGRVVRGIPSIAANGVSAPVGVGVRASHTFNCNTGSIGVSMCGMRGAVERPFNAGPSPLTRVQWEAAARVVAVLCRRYGIPVTPRTVLSHAEVQANLGITQRQKWDVSRLPFDASLVGAPACGNVFRSLVSGAM
jgi:N-acetyl-anhydromuramyl-L-alanine amidase AmpD